jgi:hypothetical protein
LGEYSARVRRSSKNSTSQGFRPNPRTRCRKTTFELERMLRVDATSKLEIESVATNVSDEPAHFA